MKRPFLVHFLPIITDDFINIRASISLKENPLYLSNKYIEGEKIVPSNPLQAFKLLTSNDFMIRIVGLNEDRFEIYKKNYESDAFGNFNFKIPLTEERRLIKVLQIYEIKHGKGVELLLGSFIPLHIKSPKKIVISDFDKTLADTRYHTTREVYDSLTRPLEYFPTLKRSVEYIKDFIAKDYHPFILSASPHFYEDAMRDWLYQHQIFTAGIFLKDYRHIFSLLEGDLTPKDLKIQGLYKLNHLLDILLMTGIPDKLVLMGDNFESDPIIYSALAKTLTQKIDPWKIWKTMKRHKAFTSSRRQESQMLNKIYQLQNLVTRRMNQNIAVCDLTVLIRKVGQDELIELPNEFVEQKKFITLYDGEPEIKQVSKKVELVEQKKGHNQR
ncbi:MAG: hypothetical protein HN576_03625 [Bacteriovoracaceae bacterium]|jgi:hypothetical protein|nr:hypothetical protein [Bacteriovoracaceae bacterium]